MKIFLSISKLKLIILIFLSLNFTQAKDPPKYGKLTGTVKSAKGEILQGANILIVDNNFGTITDRNGKFHFSKLQIGEKTLRVSYLGFETVKKILIIKEGKTTSIDIILDSKSFDIGTITVTAKGDFMPLEPASKTIINSGEIDHLQATSLNDLMSLLPGGTKENSNLNQSSKASIRGGESIGTQIVIDKVPVSNNVNMQTGIGYSTSNQGIDLRTIPAANIESVEIINGVPSAKYGDLTDGIVIVKTKAKPVKPSVKMKYNPDVSEVNAAFGFNINDWIVNSNINLASSGRDVRIEDDGYTRIALQINTSKEFDKNKIKNSLYLTKTFDEKKEQPGYALRESWYNRDLVLRFNSNYIHKFNSMEEIETTFSLGYTKRNSYKQSLISRDNIVVSDRLAEGTQDGHIVYGSYLGKKRIRGAEWNIYSDFNYVKNFYTGELLHTLQTGITYRYEVNNGEGIIFDPLYPPILSSTSPRLRTYDELPSVRQLSFYLENKIVGNMIFPFTFIMGLRYESFNPESINWGGLFNGSDFIESENGVFLNPRLNLSFSVFPSTQVRVSYGSTAKAPPLGMIAAQKKYYDIVDTVSVENLDDKSKNLSVVSTYIREQANPSLKAYRQNKFESSIDQNFDFCGLTLTYFNNQTRDGYAAVNKPVVFNKYSYPDYPDLTQRVVKDKILTTYNQFENFVSMDIKGIEVKFITKRMPVINTIFKFDAAYHHRKIVYDNKHSLGSMRIDNDLGGKVIPFYKNQNTYSKKLKINYRFDIQAESIGMWFTIHLEHFVTNIKGFENNEDKFALAYFTEDNQYVDIPEADRKDPKYEKLQRRVEDFELLEEDYPYMLNLNLVVSKSLWKGAAISFFVNNFFSNQPYHRLKRSSAENPVYVKRNSPIFYGMEFHTKF